MTEPTGNALWNIFRRKNNKERLALIRQKLKLAKGKKEEIKGGEEEGDGEEGEEEEAEEEIAEVGMVKNILSVVGTLGWASISLYESYLWPNSCLTPSSAYLESSLPVVPVSSPSTRSGT